MYNAFHFNIMQAKVCRTMLQAKNLTLISHKAVGTQTHIAHYQYVKRRTMLNKIFSLYVTVPSKLEPNNIKISNVCNEPTHGFYDIFLH